MVRSKPGGGPPSVRASEALLRIASVSSKLGGGASEALLRIASVSSKLGGGASEALAVRGARGGVSPRRRGPCRRPHCSADAAEDVTAPMLAAIARHGRGAALEKVSYPRRAECLSRPLNRSAFRTSKWYANSKRFFPPLARLILFPECTYANQSGAHHDLFVSRWHRFVP